MPPEHVWAEQVFPFLAKRRRNREVLEQLHQRDPFDNEATSLPDDVQIGIHATSAVEFYSPAHIDRLEKRLRDFGWVDDHPVALNDPSTWLKRTQRHALSGGWLRLGPIVRSETRDIHPSGDAPPLPAGVISAQGKLHQLTPSLFCVVMWFAFDQDSTLRFANTLRVKRTTYAQRVGRFTVYHNPENQKGQDVARIRKESTDHITRWFRTCLPGICASSSSQNKPAMAEIIVCENVQPFPIQGAQTSDSKRYLDVLRLSNSTDAWHTDSSLRIGMISVNPFGPREHVVVSIGTDELRQRSKIFGHSPNVLFLEDSTFEPLIFIGIVSLLDNYAGAIRSARESGVFKSKSRRTVLRLLQDLTENLASGADISTVIPELEEYINSPFVGRRLKSFKPCVPGLYGSDSTLLEYLRVSIKERAQWLRRADESLRTHLTQYGTLLGSRENLFVGWMVLLLTVVVVVFSLIPEYDKIWNVLKNLPMLLGG